MKKLAFAFCFSSALLAQAQPSHLVISQVYADGGNTGAMYSHDFVELYNPTASDVSLAGWSLQYAGYAATTWTNTNKVNLSGTVKSGKYFLIKLDGGANGSALPQPDLSSTAIVMSNAGGKVALVSSISLLSGTCPSGGTVVDLVGYKGTRAPNCSEGEFVVTPTDNVNSISRKNNGCTDTENNSADFENTIPSPRNSISNGHTCNGTSIAITAVAPNPFCVTAGSGATGTVSITASGTFTNSIFKAVLSDAAGSFGFPVLLGSTTVTGTNPTGTIGITIPAGVASSTGYRIRIEATNPPLLSSQSSAVEIINGVKNLLPNEFSGAADNTVIKLNWTNPSGCFDEILIVAKEGNSVTGTPSGDGSAYTADLNFNGNGTSFDGGKIVYKGTASGQTVTNLKNGQPYYFKAYTRRGTTWSSGTEINAKPRTVPQPGEIVINQFSPDYNNLLDEYIELVNLTDKPFDLSDVAIDVKNGVGADPVAGDGLSGILQPHSYWLILPLDVTTITVGRTSSLAADNMIDLGLSNKDNQIALVRKTDNAVLDAVGYGTITAPAYTEGTAATSPPDNGGLKRAVAGADNNNNRTDFTGVANADIELRNSKSRLANTNAAIPAGDYTTLEVTGNASLSGAAAFSEKVVMTSGIFSLNDYNLTTAAITGATAAKYIKTSGTGALTLTNVTAETRFPVGNSTHNPVTISNGGGLNWSVNVTDDVAPTPTPFDESGAVQRTWNITPSATPASGATVVFEYNDNDASQVGSRFERDDKVQVWNHHNGWLSATGPQTPVTVPNGKAVTLSDYTQFSPFVIANVNAVLPVHFVNFTARVQADGAHLQFTNISEKEVAHYEVERSVDGQDFKPLMEVLPKNNDGSKTTYRYVDATPLAGVVWYRVKGVDRDGTLSYTPKLMINKTGDTKTLTVYPNPVQGRNLTWQAALPQGAYKLEVRNSSGQQVLRQTFEHSGGNRTGTVHLPGLQPGVYRLQISSGGFVRRQTVVVL